METIRNAGAGLAPILETDDIVNEEDEQVQSIVVPTASERATAANGVKLAAELPAPKPSALGLSGLVAAAIDTTKKLQANFQVSCIALHRRICDVGTKHASVPPEVIRAMKPRARIHFYLTQPEDSQLGWLLHHLILATLILNIAFMAAETLDGPRFRSTDPGYPYLPDDSSFLAVENGFTAIYMIDFFLRAMTAPSQTVFWKRKLTWIALVGWTPALIYQGLHLAMKDKPSFDSIKVRGTINYLRLARLLRIIAKTRVYVGSKIMFQAIKDSVAPLKITLFFLITVVMVFATAIFYAEPCYDLKTCTFTDIFNAGYFVMVTVATVGYGSQVPSQFYPGSVLLSCLIMIFGSLYLAMPLAIVGIRYGSAWREHEHKKREASKSSQSSATFLADVAATAGSRDDDDIRKLKHAQRVILTKKEVDDTLERMESVEVYTLRYKICDRFYGISEKVSEICLQVRSMFDGTVTKRLSSPSQSPRSSIALTGSRNSLSGEDTPDAGLIRHVKARNEITVRVLENIMEVLKLHKTVSSDIRKLLPVLDQVNSSQSLSRVSSTSHSMSRAAGSFSRVATDVFGRARRALSSVTGSRGEQFAHMGPATWRSRTWDVLEHNDLSRRAKIFNRVRLYLVVLSIGLFYAQTTPELQATGIKTSLCRRSLRDFCSNTSPSFGGQPGCFVLNSVGEPTPVPVNFACDFDSVEPSCYGNAYNFGSDHFPSTCASVFGHKGIQRICNNRLCKPPVILWMDMESKWIGFEFFFGFLFTAEVLLRIVVHPEPKHVYRDVIFVIDLIALFPFYVEIGEIISGTTPVYSVVPTAPSFFAVIRVLKTFRVLKLGTHISGSEVLARTAVLVFRRLMIPVFFLLIGSVITGAIFYELERGTECFIGKKCIWWGEDLLTPTIMGAYPVGKRILVQNTHPALFTDMERSTWFSLTTITTVGYGDMRPRTPLGRLFDILVMIMSACYTAMPLTLVGGQFFICYEMYLRGKRHKQVQRTTVEPKSQDGIGEVDPNVGSGMNEVEHREPALVSLAGLSDDPVIPGLNAPITTSSVSPSLTLAGPALSSRRVAFSIRNKAKDVMKSTISSVELQHLNQFVLVAKVLHEIVEDLSQLNKLGSQRVAMKRDRLHEATMLLEVEAAIESKVDNNLVFCATVLLQFAPVIEKIIEHQSAHAAPSSITMSSTLNSTASERTAPCQPPIASFVADQAALARE